MAIQKYSRELESLAAEEGLSIHDLIGRAENCARLNEKHLMALSLDRKIALLRTNEARME